MAVGELMEAVRQDQTNTSNSSDFPMDSASPNTSSGFPVDSSSPMASIGFPVGSNGTSSNVVQPFPQTSSSNVTFQSDITGTTSLTNEIEHYDNNPIGGDGDTDVKSTVISSNVK